MNPFAVKRAHDLDLSAEQPVGVRAGEPKCRNSFLALDLAVSVASGSTCRRRFQALRTAPVRLLPAEDSMRVVRQRSEASRAAANTRLDLLPIFGVTAPRWRLDLPRDRPRLRETVAKINPALLTRDPFIRLHRGDENAGKQVAPLPAYLRELQARTRRCATPGPSPSQRLGHQTPWPGPARLKRSAPRG